MERDKLVAEWAGWWGRKIKLRKLRNFLRSALGVVGVHPIHILLNKLK